MQFLAVHVCVPETVYGACVSVRARAYVELTARLACARESIAQGEFVCQYVGEVLTVDEAMARPDHAYQFELQIRNKWKSKGKIRWPEAKYVFVWVSLLWNGPAKARG